MPKETSVRLSRTFFALLTSLSALCHGQTSQSDLGPSIDVAFQNWNKPDSPGCVVGVEHPGAAPLIRSYGAADLEGGIPNRESTIFEAGSVAKQFTAAATLLLAEKHDLALSDSVRKYIPELPAYATRITIAELLGHTSGLRDWGEVEAMAGWPRTSRIYGLDDVLAIIARQKSLNFPPGSAYSYTNSGFNLLAIVVARVSRQSLAEFTHDHLFVPLRLDHTQWRDDFTRVIKDRAIAYKFVNGSYHQAMPFENAYGNGGLLTTVDDLLRWNDALSAHELGEFVTAELTRQTRLNDGRPIAYARGLFVESYHGMREVAHPGSTAGYRAWLGRYPDQQLSIALLCNAGDADTAPLARAIADLILPNTAPPTTAAVSAEQLAPYAGLYLDRTEGSSLRLTAEDGALHLTGGRKLTALSPAEFTSDSTTYRFDGKHLTVESADGSVLTYIRMPPWRPSASELASFTGTYRSDEALATYHVGVREGQLVMIPADRRGHAITLHALVMDTFQADDIGLVRFHPDSQKGFADLEMSNPRVYSLHFHRQVAHRESLLSH